jgi:hypothetical protein
MDGARDKRERGVRSECCRWVARWAGARSKQASSAGWGARCPDGTDAHGQALPFFSMGI